jgi:hypothetical protein
LLLDDALAVIVVFAQSKTLDATIQHGPAGQARE